jgi:XRE family transcriptional regulator, regulator of sulfur utilization
MSNELIAGSVLAVFVAMAAGHQLGARGGADPLRRSAVFQWDSLAPTPTKVGFVRRVMQAPTTTLDELESHVTTLNPGQSPHAPHQHVNEELIILKEGAVDAYVNGEWVPVATGGMIFFGSNEPHTVRNVGSAPATYYVVNWKPRGLAGQ